MRRSPAILLVALLLGAFAARAEPPPIETYGRIPALELAALSPSGERLAYIAVRGGTRTLVLRKADGTPISTSDVGTAKIRSLDWAGEDHLVLQVSIKDRLGPGGDWTEYESFRALILNVPTREILVVFRHAKDVIPDIDSYEGARQVDGQWYGYFGADSLVTGQDRGIYRVDLDTGNYLYIAPGSSAALGPDGGVVARAEFYRPDRQWQLYAGLGHGSNLISAEDPFHDFALLGMGRTPGTVIIARPDKPDGTLWEVPVSGGPPVSLTAVPDVDVIYGENGLALGLRFEGAQRHSQYFDPVKDKKIAMVAEAFQPNRITVTSRSTDFNRLIVKSTGPDDAGTYYLVDVATQKVDRIGEDYPGLGAGQVGSVRMLGYKAADGMKLESVLTLPPGPDVKNRPVVMLPHGGPAGRDHLGFDWMAQAFASRGYVVFQPNFRGSTGYGSRFERAGDGEWGRKMQSDISDGLAELARLGIADPRRACIVGASYGGYAALAGVTVQQGLYRCAVSIGGVTDPNDFLEWLSTRHGAQSISVKYEMRLFGTESFGDEKLNAYSPVAQAAKADAPILLIYGKYDTVVPTRQSEAMAKALQKAGKPPQVVVLKEEDHWLSRDATRIQALTEAIGFVEKNNPPG